MSLVRVLVALTEQSDDRLRNLAMELICEHAILYPKHVSYAGGLRSAFLSLLEGVNDYQKPVISTFMYLIDGNETRGFVRPNVELEMVISQFTDAYTAKGTYNLDRLNCSTSIIEDILNSWTGLHYFCIDNKQSINAIVEALSLPLAEVQNILIQSLARIFKLLPLQSPSWTLQFYCIRLMLFIDAGLVEALVQVVNQGEASTCNLIFPLLSDILTMCARYLPKEYNDKVQGLPQLFASASDFKNELNRHVVQDRLSNVFKIHTEQLEVPKEIHDTELQKEALRIRLILAIEDQQMQTMITDSEVLGLKDHTKWNWDIISELVQCAQVSPSKFDVLVRITKFIPRILIFLKPSSKQFCDLPAQTPDATKIVKVCSELLCILASNEAGKRLLVEYRVVIEIAEKLQKLVDPSSMDVENIFAKEKMENTLSREYFTFFGSLQQNVETRSVLRECSLWTTYYALIELRGRDDIVKRILNTGNYKKDGHMRIIFSKLLLTGYKEMRLYTTQCINSLLSLRDDSICEWIAPLLVPQLFDAAPQVTEAALQVIKTGCAIPSFLKAFIEANPQLDDLARSDTQILFEFLRSEQGYSKLLHDGFLHNEIKYWAEEGLVEYALFTERQMANESAQYYPSHLYGSLVSTAKGTQFLKEHGQLEILLEYFYYSPAELESEENINKLKAAIWTICQIGSTTHGLDLLEHLSKVCVVKLVMDIIKSCPVLSIRGVAWHALGFLGHSIPGQELLAQYDILVVDSFCLPLSTTSFITMETWEFSGSWPNNRSLTFNPLHYRLSAIEEEVLSCIGNLTNHIVATVNSKRLSAYQKLIRIKQTYPELFLSPSLYIQSLRLTCNYPYRMPQYRFIHELFDKCNWTTEALKLVEKMHGLSFTTMMTYQVKEEKKKSIQVEASVAVSMASLQEPQPKFVPNQTIKGF